MNSGRLSEKELETLPDLESSWHWDHRDTNSVVMTRLPYEMNEMDILIMFSQWGPVAGVKLLRDRETGKSNGTAFLRYERWESTVLAVDNFNGVGPKGGIKVDHCVYRGYRYDDKVQGGDANMDWDQAVDKILQKQQVGVDQVGTLKQIEPQKAVDDDLLDPMAGYIKRV